MYSVTVQNTFVLNNVKSTCLLYDFGNGIFPAARHNKFNGNFELG